MGGYKNEGFVEVLAAQQSPENPNWFQVLICLRISPRVHLDREFEIEEPV